MQDDLGNDGHYPDVFEEGDFVRRIVDVDHDTGSNNSSFVVAMFFERLFG
ncbi:MAG: hypothetical protein HQK59_17860 [Deltaproteobacteria bacterium]|nr:hypothetical protein [Deltaproteobacteria bacterium]MBF0524013.1 hypothetical protein [Deltaproteobacteria bacterium]